MVFARNKFDSKYILFGTWRWKLKALPNYCQQKNFMSVRFKVWEKSFEGLKFQLLNQVN